jgi:hypothetical protein
MDEHPAATPERDWPTLHPQDDPDAMRPDLAESEDDRDERGNDSGNSGDGDNERPATE